MAKSNTGMTLDDFQELIKEIMTKHSWNRGIKGHAIKYVRPHFDTRSNTIFGITFDTLIETKEFFKINENRHKNLKKWIMEWLNEKEGNPDR